MTPTTTYTVKLDASFDSNSDANVAATEIHYAVATLLLQLHGLGKISHLPVVSVGVDAGPTPTIPATTQGCDRP